MTIGDRLRRERTRAGLTQAELATRIGVSREHVVRVEHGVHKPSRTLVDLWATATGAGPADLVLEGPTLFDVSFCGMDVIDPFAARRVLGHVPASVRALTAVWPTVGSDTLRLRVRGSALPSVVGLVGEDVAGIGILPSPSVQPVQSAAELVAWVRAATEGDALAQVEQRMADVGACGHVSVRSIGRLFVATVADLASDASMRMQDLVDGSPINLFVPSVA